MKKIFVLIAIVSIFLGCTSSDKKTTEDTKSQDQTGVPNVNGNIPDTTNAINLSTHKKDSATTKDSAK
jgi:hypothetical protein